MNATCARMEDTAAYVLGTMRTSERDRFDRHLRFCDCCSEELELLSEAAFVPEVMVQQPVRPPWEHGSHMPSHVRRDSVHVTGPHAPEREQSGNPARAEPTAGAHRGARRRIQPIPKGALTLLLGVLIVAALSVYMSHSAVTTTFARGTTAWPQSAGIALQLQGHHGELLLTSLPAAPDREHYEIWALPATATASATTAKLQKVNVKLLLNQDGQAGVSLPGDIQRDAAVAVYAIPDHGNGASSEQRPGPTIDDHPVAVVYVPKPDAAGTLRGR